MGYDGGVHAELRGTVSRCMESIVHACPCHARIALRRLSTILRCYVDAHERAAPLFPAQREGGYVLY